MTDPTPEQIAAAKRWTFLPPDGSRISDADVAILGDAASKDAGYAFGDNEKLFDGALRILAAALASAERDAERRLGIMHDALRWGLDTPEGSPFRCGYDSSTAASTGMLMQEEVRAAMAAQRKEGE